MSYQDKSDRLPFLAPAIVEAIAQRVAELLRAELAAGPSLLTPSEVAEQFSVTRTWVYEHADELGVIRLGRGPKARLRFDARVVSQCLSRNGSRGKGPSVSGPPSPSTKTVDRPLLPIYGVGDEQ